MARNRDLVFNEKDYTYTYLPTGETFPVECLDDFARRKLEESFARLASAIENLTSGRLQHEKGLAQPPKAVLG